MHFENSDRFSRPVRVCVVTELSVDVPLLALSSRARGV